MIEVNQNTPSQQLDNIQEGDQICYKHGKFGLVGKNTNYTFQRKKEIFL